MARGYRHSVLSSWDKANPRAYSTLPSVRGAGFGGRWRQATLQSPVGPEEQRLRDGDTLVFEMPGREPMGQEKEARQLQNPRQ